MSWDIPNIPDASMVGFRSRIGPTLTERVSLCFSPFNHIRLKLKLIYFNLRTKIGIMLTMFFAPVNYPGRNKTNIKKASVAL